jgi:hypothetical protein
MAYSADLRIEPFGLFLFLPMKTHQAVSGAQAGSSLLVQIARASS